MCLLLGAPALADEAGGRRPFEATEALCYDVTLGLLGTVGRASLRIEASAPVRDEPVHLLRFDIDAGVGPFRGEHHSKSWLSTRRLRSLRYEVDESSVLERRREKVEVYPDEGRWEGGGELGENVPADPLDELSFLYALRTLPLAPGQAFRLDRHYDARRNPALIRVLGRERVRLSSGEHETLLVEMEVRAPKGHGDAARLKLNVTDDERRTPVRIELSSAVIGTMTLSLRGAHRCNP
jgi:hypothetical protein